MKSNWHVTNWRSYPMKQQPSWPNHHLYEGILRELNQLPPIVNPAEINEFRTDLKQVTQGNAFILQMGDCAEEFKNCNKEHIRQQVHFLHKIADIISNAINKRVIRVGRIAGQYAKSRSSEYESVDGHLIPIYRGDMVNNPKTSSEARLPDPKRLIEGYQCSKATKQILDELERFPDETIMNSATINWSRESGLAAYEGLSLETTNASLAVYEKEKAAPTRMVGYDSVGTTRKIYTSHEALLLGYEESMTRQDALGEWYDTSAHLVWVGERTREPGGAHVEFARGISNPVGVKIGPDYSLDQIREVIEKLNPQNSLSKLVLITRFGANKIEKFLPGLIRDVKARGYSVAWSCDPMHGNTYQSSSSLKTRNFTDILNEVKLFFEIHYSMGTIPGGLHLETTAEDVTECVGGPNSITELELTKKYRSVCDPRLNYDQTLELASELTKFIKNKT